MAGLLSYRLAAGTALFVACCPWAGQAMALVGPAVIVGGVQNDRVVLPFSVTGWPETKHRWANPKDPFTEVYFIPLVLRQVGRTKEELWDQLKKFPIDNPGVTLNGDWIIAPRGKKGFYLTYEFGFTRNRVERIYIKNAGVATNSTISPESFSWPRPIRAFTNQWQIDAAIKRYREADPKRRNSATGGPEFRLYYVIEAPLPNGSIMRHLAFAGDAIGRWFDFKEEFDPSESRNKVTWKWIPKPKHVFGIGTSCILVATKDWWSRAEKKGERDLPWAVRAFDFMSGTEKYSLPVSFVAK